MGQNGSSGVVSPSVLKHFTYRGQIIKSLNSRGELEPLAPFRPVLISSFTIWIKSPFINHFRLKQKVKN